MCNIFWLGERALEVGKVWKQIQNTKDCVGTEGYQKTTTLQRYAWRWVWAERVEEVSGNKSRGELETATLPLFKVLPLAPRCFTFLLSLALFNIATLKLMKRLPHICHSSFRETFYLTESLFFFTTPYYCI